jgi:hypothetical protein
MKRNLLSALVTVSCVLALAGEAHAGRFENDVRARWRGAWVVLKAEAYSACSGSYDTNKVSGNYVTSYGQNRFEPGEMAKIDRVQVKRTRVQLMATLDVPVLIPYPDGPFTLYDERTCQVQLGVLVGRSTIKTKNVAEVDRLLADVVERFNSRDDAYASALWNEREREPYPDDYELTLARHAQWKAEQINLSIDEKLNIALAQASDAATDLTPDPDYLQGFAAGSEAMDDWQPQGCGQLLACTFESELIVYHSHEDGHGHDEETHPVMSQSWLRGWEDGQRLVYSLAMLNRLDACYVPVPDIPAELLELESATSSTREAAPVRSVRSGAAR